ncbi:MAG TPA: MIP/aquaporin family protein [Polyangia bacterium]|jgi:glycerol uptake facilitator-like aquaporin
MEGSRAQRLAAEGVGTALLLATVVGSSIMAERLADGNRALALLANSLATGAGLAAFILALGPISGAHFNPVVTAVAVWRRELPRRELGPYVAVQIGGALAGVVAAHLMFGGPLLAASAHARHGAGQLFSEGLATFGLMLVILGTARRRPGAVPFAVGTYITAAYWFTASTSFANPAVTLARAVTDSAAGIHPADVLPFVAAQLVGGMAAAGMFGWLTGPASAQAVGAPARPRLAATAPGRATGAARRPPPATPRCATPASRPRGGRRRSRRR